MGLPRGYPQELPMGKVVTVLPIAKVAPEAKALLRVKGPILYVQGLPGGPRVLLLRAEGLPNKQRGPISERRRCGKHGFDQGLLVE